MPSQSWMMHYPIVYISQCNLWGGLTMGLERGFQGVWSTPHAI